MCSGRLCLPGRPRFTLGVRFEVLPGFYESPSWSPLERPSCCVRGDESGANPMTRRPIALALCKRGPLSPRRRAEQLMGMPDTLERWTAARVRELPDDGNRYEAVDGVLLVTPAPRLPHQEAVFRLAQVLDAYLRRVGGAHVFSSPADIELDPHTLVQPDVFVAASVGGRRPRSWTDIQALVLAAEIVSPSSARADRTTKRRRYQRAGVLEYWVVDLDARLVERWRPADERPEILTERLTWRMRPDAEELLVDLVAYFRDVLGD